MLNMLVAKNCEGSKTLSEYKLTSVPDRLMNAGRRHETPRSETKDFTTHDAAVARVSVFAPFL